MSTKKPSSRSPKEGDPGDDEEDAEERPAEPGGTQADASRYSLAELIEAAPNYGVPGPDVAAGLRDKGDGPWTMEEALAAAREYQQQEV